ncbi:hypothetical protein FXW78_39660 [Rhodococcus opacus]|nr:hypothetical protein [Rhodococcus opacus]
MVSSVVLLDGLSWDCQKRKEPNLVAPDRRQDQGRAGRRVVDYWADETGRTVDEERALLREWWNP